VPQKVRNSILKKKWPRNDSNVKDDPYEAILFAYNKKMDQLHEANTISNKVKEEDSKTCLDGKMTKLDEEEKNTMLKTPCPKDVMTDEEEESTKPTTTPRIKTGYNNASIHLKKLTLLNMSKRKIDNIVDI